MIAQYRTITNVPESFEGLILQFLNAIPKSYDRVDSVADCYRSVSIKSAEREKRGKSTKVLVASVNSKVPRDITKFFSCGDNKTQLIDLTFKFIIENNTKSLSILKTNVIILSGDNIYHEVRPSSFFRKESLCSDQEEADTKVVLHTLEALSANGGNVVI